MRCSANFSSCQGRQHHIEIGVIDGTSVSRPEEFWIVQILNCKKLIQILDLFQRQPHYLSAEYCRISAPSGLRQQGICRHTDLRIHM